MGLFLNFLRNNEVLKNRDFMLLLLGKMVSQTGNWIYYLGVVYFVKLLTGSSLDAGLVLFCNAVPPIILGSIAGSLCDRLSRKKILIIADIFNGVVSLYLGMRAMMETATITEVYVVAFALGMGKTFFNPALNASIPNVVSLDKLNRANSLINFTTSMTTLLGPLLGGLLIAFIGSSLAFTLNGISFLASAIFTIFVSIPQDGIDLSGGGSKPRLIWRDVKEGFKFVVHSRIILNIMIVFSIMTLFISPIVIYLQELTNTHFKVGPVGLSGIFMADGLGVLLASIYLIFRPLVKRQRDMVMLFPVFCGLSLIVISLTDIYPIALAVMFVQGFIAGFGEISLMTILQKETPDQKRGMVFSLYSMVLSSMEPISLLACGYIIGKFAVTSVLTVYGGVLIAGGILLFWSFARSQQLMSQRNGQGREIGQ